MKKDSQKDCVKSTYYLKSPDKEWEPDKKLRGKPQAGLSLALISVQNDAAGPHQQRLSAICLIQSDIFIKLICSMQYGAIFMNRFLVELQYNSLFISHFKSTTGSVLICTYIITDIWHVYEDVRLNHSLLVEK